MPVVLAAVDLTAVALFAFLLAFLYATKYTLQPLVHVLHGALGWIPGAANLVDRVDNAVIGAIDNGIKGVSGVVVDLWHGAVWSFDATLDGIHDGIQGLSALHEWVWNTGILKLVHAATGETVALVHDLKTETLSKLDNTFGFLVALEAKIDAAIDTAVAHVRRDLFSHTAALGRDFYRELDHLRGEITTDIATAKTGAEATASKALSTLKSAEDASIAAARSIGSEALADIAHAEAIAAEDVLHLPGLSLDDLEALARKINWSDLASIVGSLPLIYAIVRTLEAETGLGRAECRAKVKGICSTNPARWKHLLDLLALEMAWPGLRPWVEEVANRAKEIAPAIRHLVDPHAG